MSVRNVLHSLALSLLGVVLALAVGEIFIRFSTSDQRNYVIEMWRYANLLKRESDNPVIGHEHRPNTSAMLQGVEIKINSLGMRGEEPLPKEQVKHRIAIVGDSIALGWGVDESDTLSAQLKEKLGSDYEVINAGIGNMNMAQIVARWQKINEQIEVKTVILLVTPRAAEIQKKPSQSWLLRHSQLCALASTFIQQINIGVSGKASLVDSYKILWTEGKSKETMLSAFASLADLQSKKHFRVMAIVIPETNDMNNYAFGFIGDALADIAEKYRWSFFDSVTLFQGKQSSYWRVSDNDMHLNGLAFSAIADSIAPQIKDIGAEK